MDGFSQFLGWTYFICWSSSFYGQIYETWKVKSVAGVAFDYLALNLTGFIFLSVYSTSRYFYTDLGPNPSEDADEHDGVTIQDLCFAYNAVFATVVTISQVFYYFGTRDKNKVRDWCIFFLTCLWVVAIEYGIYIKIYGAPSKAGNWPSVLGYEKLSISFVKYIPQVYLNYSRKKTVGWSIFNILMDFTGGLLSFLQVIIDNINHGANPLDGGVNVVKFALSLIAMGFDLIFMYQHYILYAANNKAELLSKRLLNSNTSSNDNLKSNKAVNPI